MSNPEPAGLRGICAAVNLSFTLLACLVAGAACGGAQQPVDTTPPESRPLPPITRRTPAPVRQKIKRQYMPALRKCANAVMKKEPSAAGVYRVEFELNADGSVTSLGSSGSSKELRACLEKHVSTWTFDPSRDEQNKPVARTISVPMRFTQPAETLAADSRMIAIINKRYMAGIHDCHRAALKLDSRAVGRVHLRYVVNVDGTITMANVMGIKNGGLLACIRRKIMTWRLPPPKDSKGKPTTKSAKLTIVLRAN